MMLDSEEYLEKIWDGILSRDPELIYKTFTILDNDSKAVVINHLSRMVTEGDWHPEQVKSATMALTVLKDFSSGIS